MAGPRPRFPTTAYFDAEVRQRDDRADISDDDIAATLATPVRTLVQNDGRVRYWAYVARSGKWLRVVTLADGSTVHNAFFDRSFKP